MKLVILPVDTINTNFLDNTNCAICKAYRRAYPKFKGTLYAGIGRLNVNDKTIVFKRGFGSLSFKALQNGDRKQFTITSK
jgi:hypothetical protein